MVWIWLIVMLLALVCEGCTTALVSIWFVPSALVSLILAAAEVDVWVQAVVFFVLSILFIAVFHKVFKKKLANNKSKATNTDMLIGEKAVVTEKIDNLNARGAVKVNGQFWSARAEDDARVIEEGEIVEIIAIKGVKLVCRK